MLFNIGFSAVAVAALMAAAAPTHAATVNVDLSTVAGGPIVYGVGASFSQAFSFGPLALVPTGGISVAFFDPGISAAANSLLSQPGNQAPLAIYLDGAIANSLTFTAGFAEGGSVLLSAYDAAGVSTGSAMLDFKSGYNVYTVGGLGNFAGIQFSATDDPAGVRYMNFSYESVMAGGVPEPSAWALMILGFGATGAALRRSKREKVRLTYA